MFCAGFADFALDRLYHLQRMLFRYFHFLRHLHYAVIASNVLYFPAFLDGRSLHFNVAVASPVHSCSNFDHLILPTVQSGRCSITVAKSSHCCHSLSHPSSFDHPELSMIESLVEALQLPMTASLTTGSWVYLQGNVHHTRVQISQPAISITHPLPG